MTFLAMQPAGKLSGAREIAQAEHIPIPLDDVTGMDANTDMDLLGCFLLGVVGVELGLNLLGTLHGVDHRREVYQKSITDRLDDRTMVFSDSFADNLVVRI